MVAERVFVVPGDGHGRQGREAGGQQGFQTQCQGVGGVEQVVELVAMRPGGYCGVVR